MLRLSSQELITTNSVNNRALSLYVTFTFADRRAAPMAPIHGNLFAISIFARWQHAGDAALS